MECQKRRGHFHRDVGWSSCEAGRRARERGPRLKSMNKRTNGQPRSPTATTDNYISEISRSTSRWQSLPRRQSMGGAGIGKGLEFTRFLKLREGRGVSANNEREMDGARKIGIAIQTTLLLLLWLRAPTATDRPS